MLNVISGTDKRMQFIRSLIEVRDTPRGRALFAVVGIPKETTALTFSGQILAYPNRLSLQIDEGQHMHSSGDIDDFLNHSCAPNTYIDFNALALRALVDIPEGAELTYNYLTTEWELAAPFTCTCAAHNCYGEIKGFRYLSLAQQLALEPLASPFLLKKIQLIKEPRYNNII